MPRLQTFFECTARALCDAAGSGPIGSVPSGDALMAVVRSAHQQIANLFTEEDICAALREAVAAPQETVELEMEDAVAAVAGSRPWVKRHDLIAYLDLFQPTIRQALRRPGDPAGTSVPQQLSIGKADDWLLFFPDRMARFKPGDALKEYDNWHLTDLRGFGSYGETWHGISEDPDQGTSCLKFITDPRAAADFVRHEDHFRRILGLDAMSGLVPLRSVYLLTDPPCLESAYVSGYDVGGLIRDWRWRDEHLKPDQASLIVKRMAKVVGALHLQDPPIVHRGLKPSNILLHPTAEGKVSIWISDIGWGELSSAFTIERTEQAQAKRQARRGALASLYASPEQIQGLPPDPRDDVYAIGVIWYQLLKRDLTARVPEGYEWALEFRKHGLTDGHARLLASCIDPNPDYRPANGLVLASQVDANFGKPAIDSGSRRYFLSEGSTATGKAPPAVDKRKSTQRKHFPSDRPDVLRNTAGMEFVLIDPGTFEMGSPPEEKGRQQWEGPVHSVTITKPYYLSIYPVTQSQFQQLMGRNPSHFTRTLGGGPNHPVEQVSWDDAIAFCGKLMEIPEEMAACRIYRLPTEAEWEFACRAATQTPFAFGTTVTLREVHFYGLSAATWAKSANTAGKTTVVDGRPPNPWGLHDMHGNVMEWCNDWWSESYYAESADTDPAGPTDGRQRVVRGGSFSHFAADCRSAARLGRAPGSRLNTVGFRIAMSIPGM